MTATATTSKTDELLQRLAEGVERLTSSEEWIAYLAVARRASGVVTGDVPDVVLTDALTLGAAIRGKRISCVELMGAFLDHIDRFNPRINATRSTS